MNTPNNKGLLRKIIFFLKLLEIRLRFVAILVVTALVVGYWDNIQNYYERWQRHRMASESGAAGHAGHGQEAAESEYEFYCAMHPFVVRDRAGKCPICGMDLVKRKRGAAVELPEGTLARVQVSPERVMQAGVQVEPVLYRLLSRSIRSYGIIETDETRVARIIARFPGRVDDLKVNAVGLVVRKGEPLARIYSPKFLAASQEYIQAILAQRRSETDPQAGKEERRRAVQLTEYARQRLALAGFTQEQLDAIAKKGEADETVTLYSPLAGTVMEKNVLLGDMVEEQSTLYTIADLSTLWVQALIAEADMAAVKVAMPVEITTVVRPGEIFYGTVDFIYPTINPDNRSGKVRIVVNNADGKLRPGMYVTAVISSPVGSYGAAGASRELAESAKAGHVGPVGSVGSVGQAGRASQPTSATVFSGSLPTQTAEDAERFLATLAPGTEHYECPMHPEVVSNKAEDCPKCGMKLEKKTAEMKAPTAAADALKAETGTTEPWAEGWACPMHLDKLSPVGGVCRVCNCGMQTTKWRIERVLSVPESAVIDTGERHVVYVEAMPGVYDARAVKLGPRAGAWYPVLDGLALNQRIVTRGSFLIDAEARLNPATAGVGAAKPESAHNMPGM